MLTSIGLPELLIVAVVVVLLALPVPTLIVLFRIKGMPDLVRVVWVLVILAFPVFGPAAFVLSRLIRTGVDPTDDKEPRAT